MPETLTGRTVERDVYALASETRRDTLRSPICDLSTNLALLGVAPLGLGAWMACSVRPSAPPGARPHPPATRHGRRRPSDRRARGQGSVIPLRPRGGLRAASGHQGKKLMAQAMTLDDNLLREILSRLPAKALGRFILTSKKWKALISDPYLKTIQAQRSTQNVLGILGITACSMGGRLTYLPLEHNSREAPDTSLGLPSALGNRISVKGACNGLLLIKVFHRILVCNPTTKYSRQLPDVKISHYNTKFGLAFDPAVSAANFRVVATERVIQEGFYKFYVYSFEANTWRLSNATIPCTKNHLLDSAASVFFNGALHWLRESEDILAFNVEQEVAYNLALPEELRPVSVVWYKGIWLGVVAGRMSLVKFERGDILVWVLEDYGSRRWEIKHRIEARGTGYYSNSVPIFYDGEKCVLMTWESSKPLCGLAVYRIYSRQWDKIRSLNYWMDVCRSFVPYISHMLG